MTVEGALYCNGMFLKNNLGKVDLYFGDDCLIFDPMKESVERL